MTQTDQEWLEARKRDQAFLATPIGKALHKYKEALWKAVKADCCLEYENKGDKAAREAWAKPSNAVLAGKSTMAHRAARPSAGR